MADKFKHENFDLSNWIGQLFTGMELSAEGPVCRGKMRNSVWAVLCLEKPIYIQVEMSSRPLNTEVWNSRKRPRLEIINLRIVST